MMLSAKLQDAYNKQINAELSSSYLYLSMAAYFESESLQGMAHWMRMQAAEENAHAMRIFDFMNHRGGRVALAAIDAPPSTWKSALHVFEDAFKHEQKITGMINDLMNLAGSEKDGASHDFLEWFCREQVEEEAAAQLIVAQLKMVGDSGPARFMVDRQLAQRSAS
jgi:ferritin